MANERNDRIGGLIGSIALKAPVRAATTANITLSGFQTIDGVAMVDGDTNLRVLVWNQTNPVDNGVWDMSSGTWARSSDFDGARDVIKGTLVRVQSGTTYASYTFQLTTSDPITIGVSNLAFAAADFSLALRNELAASGGSALSGFIQSGTGAVTRTAQAKMREKFSAADFGVAPAATAANNTTYLQAAITAAVSAGVALELPPGIVLVDGTGFTVAGPLEIYGGAGWGSTIATTVATGNLFTVTATSRVVFRDFVISATTPKTAGVAIKFSPAGSTEIQYPVVSHINFKFQYTAVHFEKAAFWAMENCHCDNNTANGTLVIIENITTPDSGDAVLENNQFYGGSGVTAVLYRGSGGLRVSKNKFLQTAYGLVGTWGNGVASGIVIVAENTFDGCTVSCLTLATTHATAILSDVVISANTLTAGCSSPFMEFTQFAGSALARVTITGNTIQRHTGSSDLISLVSGTNFAVVGNSMNGTGGNAVNVAAAVVDGLVAANNIEGVAVTNASTTTLVLNTKSGATLTTETNGLYNTTAGLKLGNTADPTASTLNYYLTDVGSTWVPILVSAGGAGVPTYSLQIASSTRIGNRVFYQGRITITAVGTLPAGNLSISGLPFTSANITNNFCLGNLFGGNLAAGVVDQIVTRLNPNATALQLYRYAAGVIATITVADLTATSFFEFSGHYQV